ncbi:MAG TPA: hypothetical protein DCZ68_03800 [Faecalibacterium sp.]|nr:hypothetical protein [Faecalibacterium sp.]
MAVLFLLRIPQQRISSLSAIGWLFPSATPPVKRGQRNARRRSAVPNYKIFFPLKMAKAHAAAISDRPAQRLRKAAA